MKTGARLTVKTFNNIAHIDKKEWDAVFPDILESYNFLKTMDESLSHQFNSYYITIYDNGKMACAAPCFIMDYPLDTTIEGPLKKIIMKMRRSIPRIFTLRTLICGSPASEGRIGIKAADCREIIEALGNEMLSIAKKERASLVAFKDFHEEYLDALAPLLDMRFHKVPSYPSVELKINFKSFEEYFSALSKATRKDLKRKFRKSDGIVNIAMEVKNNINGLADEIYELYLNTLYKSDVHFEVLSKNFFERISENMPAETKYFLWRIDGKLVAFDLCLVSRDGLLIDEYIGMDYDAAYKYHLYYVTFRDIIKWCIENNIRVYESGALNYDPKKRLDLKFIPQYIYVRHRKLFMNNLFGLLLIMIKPDNFEEAVKAAKSRTFLKEMREEESAG